MQMVNKMTAKKDTDYRHSNGAGSGPAERMTGGDLTDDISINDPCAPHKKNNKNCGRESETHTPRPREAGLKDDTGTVDTDGVD